MLQSLLLFFYNILVPFSIPKSQHGFLEIVLDIEKVKKENIPRANSTIEERNNGWDIIGQLFARFPCILAIGTLAG